MHRKIYLFTTNMGERIKKLKKIRIHREGTEELLYSMFAVIAIAVVLWRSFDTPIPFILFIAIFGTAWLLMLNFYRCPIRYFNGNYHKAWLPKASEENEHADIMIETPHGEEVLVRQIAGAMARRIVTYAKAEEECYID